MADIKKLYIELIQDYDPYIDIQEHVNISSSAMLYNLLNLQKDFKCLVDFSNYEKSSIDLLNRCNSLIDIFQALGIKASL